MTYCTPQPIYLQDYVAPDFLIETVDLIVELQEGFTIVKSHLTLTVNPDKAQRSPDLVLMGEGLTLEALAMNGEMLAANQYQLTDKTLTVMAVPVRFELDIQVRIVPEKNTELSGLYQSGGNYCTQCEAEGFRRITWFLDRPDVMARYTTTIIAEAKRYPVLLSNGNRVAAGALPDGRHWVRWEDPFKKPCYLFALVAGDLVCVEDHFVTHSGRRVTLQIFVEKSHQDQCAHAMAAVKKAMRWDEEAYGREYDLDIYMIVAVSDFNMGAMENKGLNIFNTKYILATAGTATDLDFLAVESVIAHEYFHNWSGNRVTCRDWFQLSLKEGLTIFRDQSFTADTSSRTVARIHDVNALRAQQFPEDMGPLAHPVRPDSYIEINNFYTATIYNKGAEVIRMMQTLLGEKRFREGMDLYFSRHDGHAVTIEDFVVAMENASGVDLAQFRLWYSQSGTPQLDITDAYDAERQVYTLTIAQSCAATPGQASKKPFHIPVKIGLLDSAGKEIDIATPLLQLKKPVEVFEFPPIPSQPVPSLLRGFSAPVKVNYPCSDAALALLFQHDTDEFNRWEAGQIYACRVMLGLVAAHQQGKPLAKPVEFIAAFRYVLQHRQENKWLLVEKLTLPSESYLAEQMAVVDVDAIHAAREFLLKSLATAAQDLLLEIYQQNAAADEPYAFTMPAVGRRQLKNLCLAYLMKRDDPSPAVAIAERQFGAALTHNMTDTMGALKALMEVEGPEREDVLAAFYDHWQGNALVVDKWFALQASANTPGTLQDVKDLMRHPAFDLKNPNKVYALIGAFGRHNPAQFHASGGEAYAWLADIVKQLDRLNAQVAARMIQPLIQWRRYDKKRQALMRQQLDLIIKDPKLSGDVYELVSKSLAE